MLSPIASRKSRNGHGSSGKKVNGGSPLLNSNILWMIIISIGVIQMVFMVSYNCKVAPTDNGNIRMLPAKGQPSSSNSNSRHPVSSYWWPSPETEGGFLSAIYRAQHPEDCSAKTTKYMVMQSLKNNEGDNRGLSGKFV